MDIKFVEEQSDKNDAEVIFIKNNSSNKDEVVFSDTVKKIEKHLSIPISQIIKAQKYKCKQGEILIIPTINEDTANILLVGLGDKEKISINDSMKIGGKLYSALQKCKSASAQFHFPIEAMGSDVENNILNIVLGSLTKSFHFDKYITKKKSDIFRVKNINVLTNEASVLSSKFVDINAIYEGSSFTKTLVSEPGNILSPEDFAFRCKQLSSLGLEIEVLDQDEMRKLNMNALLGVAQGSKNKPYLVVIKWNGNNESKDTLAFVGKGVTFDTGGLSLKPANAMVGMKYDMAGAGVVAGLMKTLALRKAKVNVVGVLGLVENMPGSNAQRPEDIVKTMSGQTVEVLNTDAEGRLVLADALWYTQDKFKPKFMVDLATLTGAIIVSLADQYAGLFTNDDQLSLKLCEAGCKTGEKLWRLPINDEYDKMIDSKIADMKNISSGMGAGSITAAQFLKRFVNDVPWAHLDIAGMANSSKGSDTHQAGATSFGVRLLNQFIIDNYEV